jgi:peptidoglycan/LPS O-acetylase OafA/YrhL
MSMGARSRRGKSSSEFHVSAFLTTLCVVYAAFLLVVAAVLDERLLARMELNVGLCVGGSIALLAAGALSAERAVAARRPRRNGAVPDSAAPGDRQVET